MKICRLPAKIEMSTICDEGVSTLPLYPYRCTQCGHRFEKIQSFSAEPEKVCPQCGGSVERLLTAPGLQFKGSGWYVNDYASKSSSSSTDSSSAASDAKAPAKTESAPAASSSPASVPASAPAGGSSSKD